MMFFTDDEKRRRAIRIAAVYGGDLAYRDGRLFAVRPTVLLEDGVRIERALLREFCRQHDMAAAWRSGALTDSQCDAVASFAMRYAGASEYEKSPPAGTGRAGNGLPVEYTATGPPREGI